MNVHRWIDRISIRWTQHQLHPYRFFDRSLASPTYEEHLAAVDLQLPLLEGPAHYEIEATSAVGPVQPAVHVAAWYGPERPTLIYHHANGEIPFDRSFRWIFRQRRADTNTIVVRAAFYRSWPEYLDAIRDLVRQMALLMISVRLIEGLVQQLRERGCPRIVVSGLSLGGFVANLHHTFFGSADVYRPLLAGSALGEVFVASAYRRVVAFPALNAADYLRQRLNFDDLFGATDRSRVVPVLGRYDEVVVYDRQVRTYQTDRVRTLNRGHITGALSLALLREHVHAGFN